MSFDRELENFTTYTSLEKGLSKNSVSAYRSDLADFIAFLKPLGKDGAGAVNRGDILDLHIFVLLVIWVDQLAFP